MILDLVKHSSRSKAESQQIQISLEEILSNVTKNLGLSNATWRYMGDGYAVTFLGESAGKLLDFLNASVPAITKSLARYNQSFRVGIDFGLLQIRDNSLTLCKEHFDQPGIQAARLESVAEANQVLCSSNVFSIFHPLYPDSFSAEPLRLKTKDRVLEGYSFAPSDLTKARMLLSDLFYDEKRSGHAGQLRILVVDDEPNISEVIRIMVSGFGHKVTAANTAREALALIESEQFDVVLTDYAMPEIKGDQLATAIRCVVPNVPIVMITAYSEFISNRGLTAIDLIVPKPFGPKHILRALKWISGAACDASVRQIHNQFRRAGVHAKLSDAIDSLEHIVESMSSSEDFAHIMVRHKAKHLVAEYVESFQPGNNLIELTLQLQSRLRSLTRIAGRVQSARGKEYVSYITQVVKDLKKEHKSVRVKCDIAAAVSSLQLNDRVIALLSLIMCELIDNAIEALNGQGNVEIEMDVLSTKQIFYFVVKDSGRGLPKNAEKSAFTEHFSTRGEGRGLGLYLVKQGIEKLGGSIEYKFEKGACFKVLLPLRDIAAHASQEMNVPA